MKLDSKIFVAGAYGMVGSAMREFLHVDDLAEACYVCMEKYDESEHINVGTGEDVTIKQLAETIARVVDYPGEI
jgi:GDP-L-fucose synthase